MFIECIFQSSFFDDWKGLTKNNFLFSHQFWKPQLRRKSKNDMQAVYDFLFEYEDSAYGTSYAVLVEFQYYLYVLMNSWWADGFRTVCAEERVYGRRGDRFPRTFY